MLNVNHFETRDFHRTVVPLSFCLSDIISHNWPHREENVRCNLDKKKGQLLGKNKLLRMPNWTLGWDFGIHVATNYLMLDKANKMLICSRPMELTDGAGNHALWRQSTAGAGTASELW